jgi:hypothetical protein
MTEDSEGCRTWLAVASVDAGVIGRPGQDAGESVRTHSVVCGWLGSTILVV